jgi:hypothetical protein
MLNQTIRQRSDNARNRPRDTLANMLAQPRHTVGRDSAAMFPAFGVEKKHQPKANTSSDCKTFIHRFHREKLLGNFQNEPAKSRQTILKRRGLIYRNCTRSSDDFRHGIIKM